MICMTLAFFGICISTVFICFCICNCELIVFVVFLTWNRMTNPSHDNALSSLDFHSLLPLISFYHFRGWTSWNVLISFCQITFNVHLFLLVVFFHYSWLCSSWLLAAKETVLMTLQFQLLECVFFIFLYKSHQQIISLAYPF